MIRLRSPYDRDIARLAIPALGTLIAEPLYVLADTAIVAQIGTTELAGLALATTVLLTFHAVMIFLAYGTTGQVSRLVGAGDTASAAVRSVQALWLGLGIGLMGMVALYVARNQLIGLLNGDGEVAVAAERYLSISLIGLPFMMLMLAGAGSFHGRQNTSTPLAIALGSAVLNLVIELVLVVGLDYGIGASALSTVISQAAAALAYVLAVGVWSNDIGTSFVPRLAEMRKLLSTGAALIVRTIFLRGTFTLSTALAASLGVAELAGHQIGLQIWGTLALALDAVAIAGQSITGRSLGAGDRTGAKAAAKRMIELDVVVGLATMVVVFIGRHALASLLTPDPNVAAITATILTVVALQAPLNGYVFAIDGVLIGAGDLRYLAGSLVVAGGSFVVYAPLVQHLGGGIGWLWISLTVFMATRALFLWRRFVQDEWIVTGASTSQRLSWPRTPIRGQ
ncbi:MAG: MATE family efflux transporter [Acidimicrobiales bacterium]